MRKNTVYFTVLAILISLLGIGIGYRGYQNRKPAAVITPEPTIEPTPEPTPVPTPEVHTAKLFLTGDGLIHGAIYKDAFRRGNGTYDFREMVSVLKPIVAKYDLKYYNQESLLGGEELGLYAYPLFNSPQEFGDAMVELGFNMVSTANNHSLDMGETGIQRSLEYWGKQDGVITAGTYLSFEDQEALPVYEVNGITYTFMSYTYGCNGFLPPAGKEYLVNIYPGQEEKICERVRKAKEISDVVILALHWGIEYSHQVSQEQQEFARQLADAGADIIIGNHPHVIQPVEWIGNTICFYAMGNMISAQETVTKQTGMIAGLTITKTTDHGETTIQLSALKTDLTYTYFANHINFKIYLYSELNDSILPGWENYYEEHKQIIRALDDTIEVGGMME